jgi:glycosyltransferase involved in cell wall biosynthesis
MKYWLLTTEYPPFYGGGISTYCYFTARMLAQKDHTVTVFTPENSVKDYQIQTEGNIRVMRFNSNRSGFQHTLGYTARLSYAFAHMIKEMVEQEGPPDFIEAQDYLGIAYYLQQFKLFNYVPLRKVPIVLTLHSPAFLYLEYNRVPTYKFPDFWTCEMEKATITAADGLISPTAFLPPALQPYIDLSPQSIHILPNPYEAEQPIKDTAFARNKIIFYGKLSRQKGAFALLEYFEALWSEGYTYCLEIIGGTEIVYHPEQKTMGQILSEKYKSYIDHGLLKMSGKIAPALLTDKIQHAHVVLVPSIIDNLPYVVLEAMSRGKIVLASVQGGQKEIIEHGIDGFLFDHSIDGDFKKQLLSILSLTDEQVNDCGKRAREKVKRTCAFDVIYQRKLAILEQIKTSLPSYNRFPFVFQEPFIPLNETDNNTLSVVIPFYNMGSYISECVAAVMQSTYQPLEIIIVNDGTTDMKSLAVLETLKQHESITVYTTKNSGLAQARNFGARKAQGRYLAFLDADDKVGPEYFQKAIRVLDRYENVFFVGAWTQYFGNSGSVWPTFNPQPPYALVHNPINSSALVYRKAAYLKAGLNDKQVDYGLEDYESVVALLHNGYNGVALPEVLFHYRVRSGSMIRGITKTKLIYSNKYIMEKHKAYYAKFAPQVINVLNANGPGYSYDNPTLVHAGKFRRRIIDPLYTRMKEYVQASPVLKSMLLNVSRIGRK